MHANAMCLCPTSPWSKLDQGVNELENMTPLQNDPQKHKRMAKHRNVRVQRGGKRSPDSEPARREFSKPGLGSNFGPQTCDFAGRDGRPLPKSFRRRLEFVPRGTGHHDGGTKVHPGPAKPHSGYN
jgi:hypothetical protein